MQKKKPHEGGKRAEEAGKKKVERESSKTDDFRENQDGFRKKLCWTEPRVKMKGWRERVCKRERERGKDVLPRWELL